MTSGEAPLTILCITGWCRNGSTIVGNILNEVPGVFHVGELHFLWKNSAGRGANNLCGCGATLTDCPIWSTILPVGVPDGMSPADHAAAVIRRQQACVRTRHTWRVLRRGIDSDDIRVHAALMDRVYRVVAERTGARIIVDSTKIPGEAALLAHLEGVSTYFVHLVRDPVAVAHSWRQPKQYAYAMSSSKSTAYWTGFNLASGAITRRYPQRSMFVRYEDFVMDPAGTIDGLIRLCGADRAGNPVVGRLVELHRNHTVTGNPDRFRSGTTVIRNRADSRLSELRMSARLAARILSWPLSWRYGYRRGGRVARRHGRDRETATRHDPKLEGGTVGSGT
jgi:hypothetical protein